MASHLTEEELTRLETKLQDGGRLDLTEAKVVMAELDRLNSEHRQLGGHGEVEEKLAEIARLQAIINSNAPYKGSPAPRGLVLLARLLLPIVEKPKVFLFAFFLVALGVLVATTSHRHQPQPGDSTGPDISTRGCRIATNGDGSIRAQATVYNGATSNEQANVVITLHFYGGTTMNDSSFVGGNAYSAPPGTHYVAHDFTISGSQQPIFCTASLPY